MDQEKIALLENKIKTDYSNTAGLVVLKNGIPCYENYFNGCDASSTLNVYSVTKSIVSILIGIAIDKGYIKSINQRLLDFFPNYILKEKEETLPKLTIKHLMTMSAPYIYQEEPYLDYFMSDDKVNFTLDLIGGQDDIGPFRYAALVGPDILSGILVASTGQSVLEFASQHLFSPLGIEVKENITCNNAEEQMAFNEATTISGWIVDDKGINTAGWGLTLSTMDMAKIGQLYLNKGLWEGKQIVSAEWINQSTTEHNRWLELNLPYGYLWWLIDGGFAAMGDGGNTIYVNPDKNIVVAFSAQFIPNATDRIELIQEIIEPIFENE